MHFRLSYSYIYFLIILLVIATGCSTPNQMTNSSTHPTTQEHLDNDIDLNNPPYIAVHNFIDIEPIIKISKLRAVYGHDYSYGDEEFDPSYTSCRSMKHYLDAYTYDQKTSQSFGAYNTKGTLKYYSPVDGILRDIRVNEFMPNAFEYQFNISSNQYPDIHFTFMHVDLLDNLREGGPVQAGQHLGYVGRPHGQAEIVTWVSLGKGDLKHISYFDVVTDEVFSQYQARGIETREEMTITREQRDANPIACHPDNMGGKFIASGDEMSFNIWQSGADNWAFLSQ